MKSARIEIGTYLRSVSQKFRSYGPKHNHTLFDSVDKLVSTSIRLVFGTEFIYKQFDAAKSN